MQTSIIGVLMLIAVGLWFMSRKKFTYDTMSSEWIREHTYREGKEAAKKSLEW